MESYDYEKLLKNTEKAQFVLLIIKIYEEL